MIDCKAAHQDVVWLTCFVDTGQTYRQFIKSMTAAVRYGIRESVEFAVMSVDHRIIGTHVHAQAYRDTTGEEMFDD